MGKHNAPISRRAAWTWERLRGNGPRPAAEPQQAVPEPQPTTPTPPAPAPQPEPTEAAWLGVQAEPQPRAKNGTALLPRLAAQERADARMAHTAPIERVVEPNRDPHEVTVRYPDGRLMRVDTRKTADSGKRQQWLIAAPTDARLETGMVVRVDRVAMAVAVHEVAP